MSMLLNWVSAPESKILALLATPEGINAFLDEADAEGRWGGVDKAWHGLHWLLTGTVGEGEEPLCYLLIGGTDIGDIDVGYGPARALSPAEVKSWEQALAAITNEQLFLNYNPAEMEDAGVYPTFWTNDPAEGKEFLSVGLDTLRREIREASELGNGLVIWLG